jgi:hypothetical protein
LTVDLNEVMTELTDALTTIDGLRIAVVGEKPVVPAAYVSYPDTMTYDGSYGRGQDSLTLQVVVLAGRTVARATRAALAAYADGNGEGSVKTVLDGYTYTACDSVTVTSVEFEALSLAGVDYMAAMFNVSVVGTGA